jgi:hypothetical protein
MFTHAQSKRFASMKCLTHGLSERFASVKCLTHGQSERFASVKCLTHGQSERFATFFGLNWGKNGHFEPTEWGSCFKTTYFLGTRFQNSVGAVVRLFQTKDFRQSGA